VVVAADVLACWVDFNQKMTMRIQESKSWKLGWVGETYDSEGGALCNALSE
jgi:hypothetical protein